MHILILNININHKIISTLWILQNRFADVFKKIVINIKGCMALCCFTLFMLIIVSFSSLEANEVGLNYSAISKEVNIYINK